MPRIRTFKPEFFRSPDTAKASPQARILYMAMWSWANDEGIGETNLYGLLGFAFPDEDELTVKDLQRLLAEVRGSYGVVFYGHQKRFYYSIPSWDSHQKTERRAANRFPKPDHPDSYPDLRFGTSEDEQGNSASTQGNPPAGTGEPRNLGMGNFPVGATEVCHQSAADVAPARKCSRHINDPNPPDCGGCAAANRTFKEWKSKRDRQERDELERQREKRAAAEQQRKAFWAEVRDCLSCNENGQAYGDDGLEADDGVRCPKHDWKNQVPRTPPHLQEVING